MQSQDRLFYVACLLYFFVILCHVINNEFFNIDFSLHLSSQPLTMPFIPCQELMKLIEMLCN
jgi:hypothetical protein